MEVFYVNFYEKNYKLKRFLGKENKKILFKEEIIIIKFDLFGLLIDVF